MELWSAPPGAVRTALSSPSALPPAVDMPDETRDSWFDLAPVVAGAVASGGGRLVAEYAHFVAAVVRSAGHHYGSLEHTSSGGEEFRRRFLPGPAATRYGHDAVAHLVSRDLAGLTWEEYPRLGHLTAAEVAEVAAAITGPPAIGDHPEDAGPLAVLDGALTRTARFGGELHGIYG